MHVSLNNYFLHLGLVAALIATIPTVKAENNKAIIGAWEGIAISTTAPLQPLRTLMTFSEEGTVIEAHRQYLSVSPLGPLLVTPGHGVWKKSGSSEYVATISLIYQGAENHPSSPGEVLAFEKVRFKLILDSTGNRITGTLVDSIRDLNGNLIFEGPGNFTANRIQIEPQ